MPQNRKPSGDSMYELFRTKQHAQQRKEKKAQSTQPQQYRGRYTVSRKSSSTATQRNQAVFTPVLPPAPKTPSPLRPTAPTGSAQARGYVEVYNRSHALQPVQLPTFRIVTKKNPVRKPFPTSLVFGVLCCTVFLMFFIYNFMSLSEYTEKISDLNSQLTTLKQDEADLALQVVRRDDLVAIEEYAVDKLGMIKADNIEKHYVTTISEDKTVIVSGNYKKEQPACTVVLK